MLIAFAGCDGSGKSTQVKKTANWLRSKGYEVEILDKWDILNHNKFSECRFIKTDLEDLRVCIAEMQGISRALFLFWSIAITLSKDNLHLEDKIYLLDGYWMKHAASEIIYGCSEEWIFKTVEQLPQPDITFYFDVTPEVALMRKKDLTPYECGRKLNFTDQDFLEHQSKLHMLLKKWAETYNWVFISGQLNIDEVFFTIKQKIKDHLKGSRL